MAEQQSGLISDPRAVTASSAEPKKLSPLEQIAADEKKQLDPFLGKIEERESRARFFDLLAKGQVGGGQSLRDLNLREKLKIIENIAGRERANELRNLGGSVDVPREIGGVVGRLFGGGPGVVTPGVDLNSVFDREIIRLGVQEAERVRGQGRELFTDVRDVRLGFAKTREDLLRQELSAEQERFGSFVDQRLNLLLGQTAEQGREARGEVGASQAARGLSRSTATQRGLEEVTLAEQEQAAIQRGQSFQAKTQARDVATEAINRITNQRRLLEEQFDLSKVQTIDQIKSLIDSNELNLQVQDEIGRITQDANEGQLFGTIIGGLVGGVAGFFVGGPAGAVAGAAAGTQVGGAL